MASLAPSTWKQYDSAFAQWKCFCSKNSLDFFTPSVQSVLEFLTVSFLNGASYSTLNTYRSALSLLVNNKFGSDKAISRFMKGVFRLRTPLPRYNETWDVGLVFAYFEGLSPDLSLEDLSLKTVSLVALATAHRYQTLAAISLDNISPSSQGLLIRIPQLIKTSRPGEVQPLLALPFFPQSPKLCVASAVLAYIEMTRPFRNGE